MLLGDDTGPIFTTLWNDAAIAFIEQCDALNRAEDGGGLDGVIINLDVVLVSEVRKKQLEWYMYYTGAIPAVCSYDYNSSRHHCNTHPDSIFALHADAT